MTTSYQDEVGNEIVAPLLLDDAGEGCLPRSEAPFFTVPTDLLRVVVQYMDRSSLSSFALASWDCLQLARTRRLANVSLNDRYSSISIINKLRDEGEERVRSPTGRTSRPSIGACIRRITVDTSWLSRRRRLPLEDSNVVGKRRMEEGNTSGVFFDSYVLHVEGDTIMWKRRKEEGNTSRDFFDSYVPALISIFKTRPQILPHLESLDWGDNIAIPELLSPDFPCLPIKHLRLYRVTSDGAQFKRKLHFKRSSGGWPLQVVHRQGFWPVHTSSSCGSMLRLCARTLVSLTWQDLSFSSLCYSLLISESEVLQFPCLRELRLGYIEFSDSESLATLLGTNLVTLVANTDKTDIHKQCFKNRGTIHSLKTFVWETPNIPADHPLDFLRANPQLSKFRIPYQVSSAVLETRLLPLLSSSFGNLCSLSLVWEGDKIPASAVKIISTIKSLEQIHLSAGDQQPEYNWAIDHQSMRICLSSLPYLRKVAFSCDSYSDPFGDVFIYYAEKALDLVSVVLLEGEDLDSQDSQDAVWERLHKERMLAEARKYTDALPKLEWLYIGQLTMSVVESQTQRGVRCAIPLCPKRAELSTTLEKMFG